MSDYEKKVSDAIQNLRQYVREDAIYSSYKNEELDEISDFEWFCIDHCSDIETLIKDNIRLKEENDELKVTPDYDGYLADKMYEEKKLKEF